ncbi:MAG: PaaI family thioesterase [Rhizobiaceae bacterium]
MTHPKPVMTTTELNAFISEVFPQLMEQFPEYTCTLVEAGRVVVQIQTSDLHIRAGGTVSGPTLFSLADMGGYACVLSHVGREALAVTTNLNINFMRKAEPGLLIADCKILKLGKRLMVFEAAIMTKGSTDLIAHATGTYAIPPMK